MKRLSGQWAARGMARAAQLLADRYTLVITNVPYLARGKQGQALRVFCERNYPRSKNDLATAFLERCLHMCAEGGTASLVLPQNWLFLTSYRTLRQQLLVAETWRVLAWLGAGAFETVTGEVVKAVLLTLSRRHPLDRSDGITPAISAPSAIRGLDVSDFRTIVDKAAALRHAEIVDVEQAQQLTNPDARVTLEDTTTHERLDGYCISIEGLTTGDLERFVGKFWEGTLSDGWEPYIQNVASTAHFGARTDRILWESGIGTLARFPTAHNFPRKIMNGRRVLGKPGLRVTQMISLSVTTYTGELFGKSGATVVPDDPEHLPAIWCYCSSPEYSKAVRRIDPKLNVTNATLAKVPFDLDRWTKIADKLYTNGLPCPYSDDPTQWIFHGHPCGSVVWDTTQKETVHGPLRTDGPVLQVAVARLLGYRWPPERDAAMELANEQREWVRRTETLLEWMDEGGIVCIPSVRGEPPARDRLLGLLGAAYGDKWSDAVLTTILANVDSHSLEAWLRDRFFDQHCKLFHHRPFVWHIWDGRRRDGFHALVNYHKLAAGDGKGRQLLESLTCSYLGDWIVRQRDGAQRHEEGAEDRLAAACELQRRLEAILEGEPSYDIFVRWKSIHEQPIGWEPDINDGVRLNIRPFMAEDIPGGKKGAGVLRTKPKIAWKKDRGKEVLRPVKRSKPPWLQDDEVADVDGVHELRPREDYPWFWNCPGDGPQAGCTDFRGGPGFDGNRWNDLHYTNAMKSAARERKRERATTRKFPGERMDDPRLAATDEQSAGGLSDQ